MSGIYILVTKNSYRVKYSKNYINFFLDWNEEVFNFDLNGIIIKQEFDDSPIFLTEKDAFEYAQKISHKYPETDDGICYIKNASDKTYEEIING